MIKVKNIIVVVLLAVFLGGFGLWSVLLKDKDISESERRELAKAPEVSWNNVISGNYMNSFEDYVLDQFPLREKFLDVKNLATSKLLFQKSADYYVAGGYATKLESKLDEESVAYATERFRFVYDKYLKDSGSKIYLSIVPDKNYFLAKKNGYLPMNYNRMTELMRAGMEYAEYIDIYPYLSIEDYYYSDTHWRQECIEDVAVALAEGMGRKLSEKYEQKTVEVPFYGYYYNLVNRKTEADTIHYLTNEVLENAIAFDYETNKQMPVYTLKKAEGKDPYEIFLGGSKALITIENEQAADDRELIIFRDSFGSSLTPLLVGAYRKITVVDIRYMMPVMIGRFIDFTNKDVLFIYNTAVLNHSETIK